MSVALLRLIIRGSDEKGAGLQRHQERYPTISPKSVTAEHEGHSGPRGELAKYINFTWWLSLGQVRQSTKYAKLHVLRRGCSWKKAQA